MLSRHNNWIAKVVSLTKTVYTFEWNSFSLDILCYQYSPDNDTNSITKILHRFSSLLSNSYSTLNLYFGNTVLNYLLLQFLLLDIVSALSMLTFIQQWKTWLNWHLFGTFPYLDGIQWIQSSEIKPIIQPWSGHLARRTK